MTYIKVAQQGADAGTDPVQDMLIDSNYKTMLVAFQGNTSITTTSSLQVISLGSSLGFVPSCVFITTGGINGGNLPSGVYSYEAESPIAGLAEGLFAGDPWTYTFGNSGTTYDYMYYVYYLPSQEPSSSASDIPPNIPPYINVGNIFNPATTSAFENLSFTSQTQSLQIFSQQTFNVSGTLAASSSATFTFAHNLGIVTPFIGIIQNYSTFGLSANLTNETCVLDVSIKYNRDEVGMDSSNLYYYYVNNDNNNSQTVNFNVTIYFFIQPS